VQVGMEAMEVIDDMEVMEYMADWNFIDKQLFF
jgi:hypothetical protein